TQIFGYTIEEALHRQSIDLIVPAELRAEAATIKERLKLGETVNVETIRMRKDGLRLQVSEVAFPVIADGKTIGYYIIFRDITDSKRAIEELQKGQADLAHLSRITTMGELAASIAHEINQPIVAIVTNGNAAVRWLSQRPPGLDGAEEALECIVRDADRAAQVIGRIRSLLKKNPTPMVQVDINEAIREVLLLTTHETHRRQAIV